MSRKINDGLTNAKRYNLRHPEIVRERNRKWRRDHRTWSTGNCFICGRFCSKYRSKYCSDCAMILKKIEQTIFINYLKVLTREELQ